MTRAAVRIDYFLIDVWSLITSNPFLTMTDATVAPP
jgi:hypothetical protein